MNWQHWLASRFTDWLASPRALMQGIAVTVVWCLVILFGGDNHGFWFLFFATVISFITQFPLAFAARRAAEASRTSEEHLLHLMQLIVALVEDIKGGQDEQDLLLEELQGHRAYLEQVQAQKPDPVVLAPPDGSDVPVPGEN